MDPSQDPNTQLGPTWSVTDWSQLLASPGVSLSHVGCGWVKFVLEYSQAIGVTCKRCLTFVVFSLWCKSCMCLFSWGVLLFVGWWVVYSPLFSLVLQPEDGTGKRANISVLLRHQTFCLTHYFHGRSPLLLSACLQEKLLPRLCVPVGMSPFFPSDGLVAARLGWALQ